MEPRAVEYRWQERGLLTRRLIWAAPGRGVRVFTGIILPRNARMPDLIRESGLPGRLRFERGIECVEIELSSSPDEPPA